MSKSARMKINDYSDFGKEQEEPLLTAETEYVGGAVVNNAG